MRPALTVNGSHSVVNVLTLPCKKCFGTWLGYLQYELNLSLSSLLAAVNRESGELAFLGDNAKCQQLVRIVGAGGSAVRGDAHMFAIQQSGDLRDNDAPDVEHDVDAASLQTNAGTVADSTHHDSEVDLIENLLSLAPGSRGNKLKELS